MFRYVVGRIGQAIPLLLGVVVINFLIIHLAPGDPVQALVGDFPAPEEYVRQVRADFGLDKPLWQQLLIYLGRLGQGDLGFSFANRQSVVRVVGERVAATALLTGTALLFATVAGVALGIFASRRPSSASDAGITALSLVGYSLPVFWLGQILIIVFAVGLGWLPAQGMVSLRTPEAGFGRIVDIAAHLTLPALALCWRFLAINSRLTRASMLETLGREYIRTAKAKGLAPRAIVFRHALPNALLPVVTLAGYNLGFLLAGSALVETVFGWPGLGRLLYDSVFARDYPVLLGIFLTVAVTVIVANLLTDLLYAFLDPRIRYGS